MVVRIRQGKDDDTWILPVKVTPKGGKDCLLPLTAEDTALKLKVSAPPEKGEANDAVVHLLAKVLALPKSSLKIIRGETARQKQVEVQVAWSPDEWRHRLVQVTSAPPAWFEFGL